MVIVIGGGITGLSLAYFLKLKGYDVTVIEKEVRLGGNASWVKLGDFNVDNFYHIITSHDVHLLSLLEQLEISDEIFSLKTRMGFYKGGDIYPISTVKEFLLFPPISLLDRIRMGIGILRNKMVRDWQKLDNITASEWLSSLGGRGNYEKLWRPVMQSKFGPAADNIAATDMWFRINRISGLRKRKFKEGAYYIKGSLKAFFDALENNLKVRGVRILKGSAAENLKVIKGRIAGLKLADQNEIPCTKLISTVALPDFINLLPENYQEYAAKVKLIKYLNNVCLILRLKQRLSHYYQLNIGEEGFPFTGLIGADLLYPPADFAGGYILYISKYFCGESELWSMDEESILEYYTPYLKNICPKFQKDWVLDIALTKKENVETVHSLHYSQLIPSFETPITNLYLLCTAQIYPEPTLLDTSVKYAKMLVNKFFNSDEK